MKRPIWKGPSNLGGLGNRESVGPGEEIPEGHVTAERLKELGDRVEYKRPPEPEPEPEKEPEPEPETETAPPSPPPRRGPGRPPGKNKK